MPPTNSCLPIGPPSRELTEVFCRVPSMQFSQAPWYTLPVHLCWFRVRSYEGLFPGTTKQQAQSNKNLLHLWSVTSFRPRNINLVPIDYAFRPRLRGRLTLLRLALSRNPWTFGDRVSHPVYRYSCQHSHFRSLHRMPYSPASQKNSFDINALRSALKVVWIYITERSATTLYSVLSFGSWLEPRYIFAATQLI